MRETPKRLDALLVERGLAPSRARARALILSGAVRVGDRVVTKAGSPVASDEPLRVSGGGETRFVSRGGEKLEGALEEFALDVEGKLCLDAGASTGGFTDVLLRRGASGVIAVDVGYGQLEWSLRGDERVTVMERRNVRYLTGPELPLAPELLVADLSFISLKVALEGLLRSTPSLGEAVLLVKPQFEAGKDLVGRGGLVRDPEVHADVIIGVMSSFEELGFGARGLARASLAGRRAKNQEYLLYLVRGAQSERSLDRDGVVAHIAGSG